MRSLHPVQVYGTSCEFTKTRSLPDVSMINKSGMEGLRRGGSLSIAHVRDASEEQLTVTYICEPRIQFNSIKLNS